MTELSFLVDLLLKHKLPKPTKEAVAARIVEVEAKLVQAQLPAPAVVRNTFELRGLQGPPTQIPAHLVGQSPSTIAAMMRHEQTLAVANQELPPPRPEEQALIDAQVVKPAPQPVTVIAQTPAAAAAMADRNAAIVQAVSGKPEKGRTSPRKF